MTCRDVTQRLLDYHGNEVDRAHRRGIEAHLMVCDCCLRYLRDYDSIVRLARSVAAGG